MISRLRLLTIIFIFGLTMGVHAAWGSYETGPRHVGSAWNINKGALYMSGQGRFYSKHDVYMGPNDVETGVTVWDSQISSSLFWGLGHHLELGILPILSQKNHDTPGESDVPGDLFLNAKLGSIGPRKAPFKLAVQFDLRLPTGNHHNIPLHPYSAGAVGYGGMGLLSINTRPSSPNTGFAWDLNLGYFNHNDRGLVLTKGENDTMSVQSPTTEMIAGSLVRLMGKRFGLFAEIRGRFFIQQPPETAYTRENSMYLTPGFIFQFNPYIQLIASADLLMQGRDDETSYGENGIELVEKPWETVPNLPDWRFNFGLSLRLRQGKPPAAKPEVEAAPLVQEEPEKEEKKSKKEKKDKKEEARDYRELENQLKKRGDKKGEETEEERERKRQAERERMQDVLDRLREAMEKEKNQPESPQE